MAQRLVVGFDGSEPSKAALKWALARGGPLVVAHVSDQEAEPMGDDNLREEGDRRATAVAEALELAAHHTPPVIPELVELDGPVAWALTSFATPDDLLVIGTHKTGHLNGRVLGSRSVEVAMLARCDVAVIPAVDLRFRRGVVAGTSDGAGDDTVAVAASEAERRDEELVLIRSGPTHSDTDRVLQDAMLVARRTAPGTTVRTRASNRPVSALLLDAARDRALLVIGSGRERTKSPIGTVLHDVLLNLATPTLVVHSRATDGTP